MPVVQPAGLVWRLAFASKGSVVSETTICRGKRHFQEADDSLIKSDSGRTEWEGKLLTNGMKTLMMVWGTSSFQVSWNNGHLRICDSKWNRRNLYAVEELSQYRAIEARDALTNFRFDEAAVLMASFPVLQGLFKLSQRKFPLAVQWNPASSNVFNYTMLRSNHQRAPMGSIQNWSLSHQVQGNLGRREWGKFSPQDVRGQNILYNVLHLLAGNHNPGHMELRLYWKNSARLLM